MDPKALSEVSGIRGNRGQALIELAVFGMIFLMIIGAMITYGLNYNYNQEAQMKAFRTAMTIASSRGGAYDPDDAGRSAGTYMVLEEKHIPDPMDPYGAGSPTTIMASASVTRDSQLHATPAPGEENINDLPSVLFEHQTSSVNNQDNDMDRLVYRTAGFRIERTPTTIQDPSASMVNTPVEDDPVAVDDDGHPISHHPEQPAVVNCDPMSPDYNIDACVATSSGPTQEELRDRLMMKYQIIYGDVVDVGELETGTRNGVLRITDACAGEVVEYEPCYEQALKMIDVGQCSRSCARSLPDDSEYSCFEICQMKTNSPNQESKEYSSARGGAWYAANWEFLGSQAPDDEHRYRFPILEGLFTEAGIDINRRAAMGLQDSPSVRRTRSAQTRRIETTDAIQTDDRAEWTTATERPFILNRNLNPFSGYDMNRTTAGAYLGHTQEISMNSTWTGRVGETSTTAK